ncbi:MAG: hypothetical protein U0838_12970 [Chloroflexota bacterium]
MQTTRKRFAKEGAGAHRQEVDEATLRELYIEKRATQSELAEYFGVSRSLVRATGLRRARHHARRPPGGCAVSALGIASHLAHRVLVALAGIILAFALAGALATHLVQAVLS